MPRTAYLDESFLEDDTAGFYVLAAAVLDDDALDGPRQAMLSLRTGGPKRRSGKVHWHEMGDRVRRDVIEAVAQIGEATHFVAVGTPVRPRRQERARAVLLRRVTFELHNLGVTAIRAESRGPDLDLRDVRLVQNVRYDLPKGTVLVIEHERGTTEPLLWLADIVAGAIRASRQGEPRYRDALAGRLTVLDVAF